jgi:hypothetical protein|tara:strand:+ start:243 stop:1142 length:900 start_codon:yes stop_codon:yes gene_type:complete
MTFRSIIALLAVVAIAACGGAATEEQVEVVEELPMDDAAAIAAMIEEYNLHFNMGHSSMAADYHTDGIFLPADGSVIRTAESRLAWYEAQMVGNPENQVSADDVLVLGDSAVAHGSYSTTGTPEGEPVTRGGNWMARLNKVDGNWRWAVGLSNMDTAPPEDLPAPVVRDEGSAEVEDSLIAELMGYYGTHFNMGHAGMVASRYAEDAVAAISGRSKMVGRAAIEEDMSARMEAAGNPQLTIHVAGAQDLGDGYVFGGGWYETASDSGNQAGSFLVLARADDDGNMQIQWTISNGLSTNE